jgi:tetratricopeptide (TPR) repeat protein
MDSGSSGVTGWVVVAALLAAAAAPAHAIMSGDESERPQPAAPAAFAQGRAAFEREDWPAVIEHMSTAVDERPWDDDAYNLMGFAYRKLGDYDRALAAYDRALALNPHHRGALEYLGEAYLELDQPERAKEMLDRIEIACRRVAAAASNDGWQSDCEEWQELDAAYRAHQAMQAER